MTKINCTSIEWRYQCPRQWAELALTNDNDIRYCNVCSKNIYAAFSNEQANELAKEGKCVAIMADEPLERVGYIYPKDDYV